MLGPGHRDPRAPIVSMAWVCGCLKGEKGGFVGADACGGGPRAVLCPVRLCRSARVCCSLLTACTPCARARARAAAPLSRVRDRDRSMFHDADLSLDVGIFTLAVSGTPAGDSCEWFAGYASRAVQP